MCTSVFGLTTEVSFSQETVTIQKDQLASINEVFKIIKKQTDYRFIYPKRLFKDTPKVQLKKGEIRITKLLRESLSSNNLDFELSPNNVIIIKDKLSLNNLVQQKITGKVTDKNSIPLAGITIYVTNNLPESKTFDQEFLIRGTVTNFDGSFEIIGEVGYYLVVTGLGYELSTQEITADTTIFNIMLEEKASTLEEVIVVATGYQTISKERNAGSYAKADVNVLRNRSTSTNVLSRLDGLVPGLFINNAPTDQSDDGLPISIRGFSSINANRSPLFVVDGVPINDVSRINPQDVESIYVLKDATANSIYGSRATNGVIVITTKKGGIENKLQVDYDSYIAFQGKTDLNYTPRLNSQQFIQTAEEIFSPSDNPYSEVSNFTNVGHVGVQPHEQILYDLDNGTIDQATATSRLNALASFDNLGQIEDLFYRNAILQNHTLSVRGGGEKYSIYGSIAYTNAQDDTPNNIDETYKLNVNQDYRFNNFIKVSLIADLTNRNTKSRRPIDVDGNTLPYIRFQDESGNPLSTNFFSGFSGDDELAFYENATGINLNYTPLEEVNKGYTKGNDLNARINLGLDIDLSKKLKFQGRYGYVHGNSETSKFDNEDSFTVRFERAQFVEAGPIYFLPEDGGHYAIQNIKQRDWLLRNQLNYENSWLDKKHQLSVLLGQEVQENFNSFNRSFVRGYNNRLLTSIPVDLLTLSEEGIEAPIIINTSFGGTSELSLNEATAPFTETEITNRISSFYGNFGYTYNQKYSLNGSWRIDESNLFGIDKSAQNKPIWSVGGKWNISNEPFLQNSKMINTLALRVTYGITGNSPIPGESSSFDVLEPITDPILLNNIGLGILTPGNDKLTWETTETINVGLDYTILNNRINGSIDYYQRKTTDLIGALDNNILTGFPSVFGNLGNMENNGIELLINSLNINTANFSWSTTFNLAYNKNTITKLNSPIPLTSAEALIRARFVEGQSAFAIYSYDYAGLDNLGDPQVRLADGTITKTPGEPVAEDLKFEGSYLPKITGGFGNTLTYKGFTLNANIVYNFGAVMRADVPSKLDFTQGRLTAGTASSRVGDESLNTGNVHADFFNRWRQPGDENLTNVPSFVADISTHNTRRNTDFYRFGNINVLSADYIKLRDITLSYALPQKALDFLNADNIAFRLQLSNVMLWRKNDRNIDPEFHQSFFGIRSPLINQETITAGIHLTF
ncbi:SusC/RagA family TonB-linked outer membrane protein [Flavivirga amylovorans]